MSAWRHIALAALVTACHFAQAQGQAANGELIAKMFSQQVLVENKPGGSVVVAVQAARQAPADGHTELGEFQLREYKRFKRVAELAGIAPE